MTKNEALRLALKALEFDSFYATGKQEAITAIKAALEAKDEPIQEPAAWISKHNVVYPLDAWHEVHPINELKPLYTNPPQRKPLTDEEVIILLENKCADPRKFVRQIEIAHGIKGEV